MSRIDREMRIQRELNILTFEEPLGHTEPLYAME